MSERTDVTWVHWIAVRYMLDREYSDVYAFRVWVWSSWAPFSKNMSFWVSPTQVRARGHMQTSVP